MMDWVITSKGNVRRRDRVKKTETVDDEVYGHKNSFPDKEAAYVVRDGIIDDEPCAFLDNEPIVEEEPKEEPMPRKVKVDIDQFRDMSRDKVMKHMDDFWASWGKLNHRDKCDTFLKFMAFAYPRSPSEKPLDEEGKQRQLDRKREQTASVIASGIQDEDFEE